MSHRVHSPVFTIIIVVLKKNNTDSISERERSTAEEITLNQHARDKLLDKLFKYVCWLFHRVQWNMRVSGKLGPTQTGRFTDFRGENLRNANHKFSDWKTRHIGLDQRIGKMSLFS